jgi:sRNA-binding carbon storage regulator CsrA
LLLFCPNWAIIRDALKLCIDAPDAVDILREEIAESAAEDP